MTKPADDLDAIRTVLTALEPFEVPDRQRIIRFVLEKLALPLPTPSQEVEQLDTSRTQVSPVPRTSIKNLSTFVKEKSPKNDVQFAATVAYFYRFEAPPDKRKAEINAEDLQDACRLAPRKRFKYPGQTLRNAKNLGLLDNGSSEGLFAINSVGENLVAMALPSGTSGTDRQRKPRKRKVKARPKGTGAKK